MTVSSIHSPPGLMVKSGWRAHGEIAVDLKGVSQASSTSWPTWSASDEVLFLCSDAASYVTGQIVSTAAIAITSSAAA